MISKHGGDKGDRPVPTHETAAEQTREAKESEEAFSAGGFESGANGGHRAWQQAGRAARPMKSIVPSSPVAAADEEGRYVGGPILSTGQTVVMDDLV